MMSTTRAMQRVIITIPPALLSQIETTATKLNYSRSRLIREALEQYLANQQRLELREQLKEGYVVHAARDLRICEEFAAADYEVPVQQTQPDDREPQI